MYGLTNSLYHPKGYGRQKHSHFVVPAQQIHSYWTDSHWESINSIFSEVSQEQTISTGMRTSKPVHNCKSNELWMIYHILSISLLLLSIDIMQSPKICSYTPFQMTSRGQCDHGFKLPTHFSVLWIFYSRNSIYILIGCLLNISTKRPTRPLKSLLFYILNSSLWAYTCTTFCLFMLFNWFHPSTSWCEISQHLKMKHPYQKCKC